MNEQKWAIRSRRVLTAEGQLQPAVVDIENGTITAVREYDAPVNGRVQDVGAAVVMPGVIDAHVHINEPGRTDWEGFTPATRAAAAGGITTLVDMPLNCDPVTVTPAAWRAKLAAARDQLHVNVGFYAGVIPGHTADLDQLLTAGAVGGKAFMIDSGLESFPAVGVDDLRAAMRVLAAHGKRLLAHAEWSSGTAAPEKVDPPTAYDAYLRTRPPAWETAAVQILTDLCAETGCAVHVVHVAAAEVLPLLRAAKQRGLPITAETAPHYLHFCAADVPAGDTRYKCAPPIREAAVREALWAGLRDGTLDMVASDHSPCLPNLKALDSGDFGAAWGGISGMQWLLSVVWTGARARGFTVADVARWTSTGPARVMGLSGGRIAPGAPADLVIWSPEETVTVTREAIYHRHPITPYEGARLHGRVQQTVVGGRTVYNRAVANFEIPPVGKVILSDEQ